MGQARQLFEIGSAGEETARSGIKPIEDAYRARVQSCTVDVVAEPDVFEAGDPKTPLGLRAVVPLTFDDLPTLSLTD